MRKEYFLTNLLTTSILFFVFLNLSATPILKLHKNSEKIRLDDYLFFWSTMDSSFMPQTPEKLPIHGKQTFNVYYNPAWHWLSFEFEYQEEEITTFYFVLDKPTVQRVRYILKANDKVIAQEETGIDFPFEQRGSLYHRNFVFKLQPQKGVKYRIFLCVHNPIDSLNGELRLLNEDEFLKSNTDIRIGVFIGCFLIVLMVAMAIILVYIKNQQVSGQWFWYLSYPIYTSSLLLNILSHEGFAYQYLWSNSPSMAFFSKSLFLAIAIPSLLAFTYAYLQPYIRSKWIQPVILLVIALFVIDYAFLFFSYHYQAYLIATLSMKVHSYLLPFTGLAALGMSVYYYIRERQKDLLYLLIAMSPVLVTSIPFMISYTFALSEETYRWNGSYYIIWSFYIVEIPLTTWVVIRRFLQLLRQHRENQIAIQIYQEEIEEKEASIHNIDAELQEVRKRVTHTLQEKQELAQDIENLEIVLKQKEKEKAKLETKLKRIQKNKKTAQKSVADSKELYTHIIQLLENHPQNTYLIPNFGNKQLVKKLQEEYNRIYSKRGFDSLNQDIGRAIQEYIFSHPAIEKLIQDRKKSGSQEVEELKQYLQKQSTLKLLHFYRYQYAKNLIQEVVANHQAFSNKAIAADSGYDVSSGKSETFSNHFRIFYRQLPKEYYDDLRQKQVF